MLRRLIRAALTATLVTGTALKDVDLRKKLAEGGADALAAQSSDPMLGLARLVDSAARRLRSHLR